MGDKLVIKQSGSNIEIPIMGADASAPRLGIKGKGYIPLDSNGTGSGVYVKLNGNKYKFQTELNALKFSSDGNFKLSVEDPSWDGTLQYSTDNGDTWNTWNGSELNGTATQPIYIRGTGNTKIIQSIADIWTFTGKYCTGNIETLLDYEIVANGGHPTMDDYCYHYMFYNCTSLITPPQLPATKLTYECYWSMFQGCTSLTTLPDLPATMLADYCYFSMFDGCTSLKLSTVQDSTTYKYAYRIPTSDTGTTATNALTDMFTNTGGTFKGTPIINTTYYTDHQPV